MIGLFLGRAQALSLLLFASLALANCLVNVTVDDAVIPGPEYYPEPSDWNQGNDCSGCLAMPDPAYAYNGTWHDATFTPGSGTVQQFQYTFTGNGLYIYFILANQVPGATTNTNVSIYIDNQYMSTFNHNPSSTTDYEYNQTVYANASIPYGQHTVLVTPVNDGSTPVLMLFDYLVYTTLDDN